MTESSNSPVDWFALELIPDLINVHDGGFTEQLNQFQELHGGFFVDCLHVVDDKMVEELHDLVIKSRKIQVIKNIHMKMIYLIDTCYITTSRIT